jgi:hypothetical protein
LNTYEFTFILVGNGETEDEALDEVLQQITRTEPTDIVLLEIDGEPVPYMQP